MAKTIDDKQSSKPVSYLSKSTDDARRVNLLKSEEALTRPRKLNALPSHHMHRRSNPDCMSGKPWEPKTKPLMIQNCSLIEDMVL